MGLQVRLRHALGERLFDLEDRAVEQPLIFGRAREADLKIPSVTVASQHCALFLHDGHWVLQDMSGGATWVNGSPMEGPTPLCVGDVITLGGDASPATVEIDPAGAEQGRTGQPAQSEEAAVTAYSAAPAAPAPLRRPSAAGHAAAAPAPPPISSGSAGWDDQGGDDAFAGFGQGADVSAGGAVARRRAKPKKTSDVAIVGGIGLSVLIIIGVCWLAYTKLNPEPAPAPPAPAAAAPTDAGKQYKNIFDMPNNHVSPTPPSGDTPSSAAPKAAPTPRVASARPAPPAEEDATADASGAASTPAAADAPAPRAAASDAVAKADDKDWDDVEGAAISPEIGQAILKFDDYRRQHPGVNTAKLDALTDEGMDRLWWSRIAMLCKKRDDLNKAIRTKEKDIREEPTAGFKKTLKDEEAAKQVELARVLDHLNNDMGYANAEAPNIDSADSLSKLRADRDSSKFGDWKMHTLKFIRAQHGATPWDGE